jgi:hypothetical protein
VRQKAWSCHRLQEGTLTAFFFAARALACKAPKRSILLRISEKETTALSKLTQHGINKNTKITKIQSDSIMNTTFPENKLLKKRKQAECNAFAPKKEFDMAKKRAPD